MDLSRGRGLDRTGLDVPQLLLRASMRTASSHISGPTRATPERTSQRSDGSCRRRTRDGAAGYWVRAAALMAQLEQLDDAFVSALSTIPLENRKLVVYQGPSAR